MKVTHPNYTIEDQIDSYSLETFTNAFKPEQIDAIIIATKGMATESISQALAIWTQDSKAIPYYISLQNGVENEQIMASYYSKEHVIGGLTRLIVSHTIELGHVHCEGGVETLIGALHHEKHNQDFLHSFKAQLDKNSNKKPSYVTISWENFGTS